MSREQWSFRADLLVIIAAAVILLAGVLESTVFYESAAEEWGCPPPSVAEVKGTDNVANLWRIHITDKRELDRFIRDLKTAARKSRRSGGGYSVFLKDALDPARTLQIELCLRMRSPRTVRSSRTEAREE